MIQFRSRSRCGFCPGVRKIPDVADMLPTLILLLEENPIDRGAS